MTVLTNRLAKEPVSSAARFRIDAEAIARLLPQLDQDDLPTRRDLLLQALMHLPRLAHSDRTVALEEALREIGRLRQQRATELEPLRSLATPPPRPPSIDQLHVTMIDAQVARPILDHFHYLRSFRSDSVSVAALYQDHVVALCSISPFDLAAIGERLPVQAANEVAVVSRVFAFDWAPRNVISYLLSRAERSPAIARDVRMLTTYLNPNLGFRGASYRAANWCEIGIETGTRYAYLNGDYITDRQLAVLSPELLAAVDYSRIPLEPLRIYGRFRDRKLARVKRDPIYRFLVRRAPTSSS